MLNKTILPDKRTYETYKDAGEWNTRLRNLKAQKVKVESGHYDSVSGIVYYIIYKE